MVSELTHYLEDEKLFEIFDCTQKEEAEANASRFLFELLKEISSDLVLDVNGTTKFVSKCFGKWEVKHTSSARYTEDDNCDVLILEKNYKDFSWVVKIYFDLFRKKVLRTPHINKSNDKDVIINLDNKQKNIINTLLKRIFGDGWV